MLKNLLCRFIPLLIVVNYCGIVFASNYTLEITQPQSGLTERSRYYKAYPGIKYEIPVGVFGGAYPFTYELTTAPSGMTIDSDTGIITWSNPTTSGSPHSVAVQVTDTESSTDSVNWTITVTTSGFVFLDDSTDPSEDGTIDHPFDSLEDIWGSDGSTTTYDDFFLYFRAGTYGIEGGQRANSGTQQYRVNLLITRHPHVWMAYPNETVVLDHDLAPGSNGLYISLEHGGTDAWFSGIKFQDMRNHAIRGGGRMVYYNNTFYNGGPGADGQNSSFLMFPGTSYATSETYGFIRDNTFDTASTYWAFIKSYSTYKAVFEGNIFKNPNTNNNEGLALKAYDQYVDVRGNTFDGDFKSGSIGGDHNGLRHCEIRFNKVINATTIFINQPRLGAFPINCAMLGGVMYVYRNTFEGNVILRNNTQSRAPIYFDNNVVINENSSIDDPNGSGVTAYNSANNTYFNAGSGGTSTLYGSIHGGIIDANGNLSDSYSSFIGTHGYQISSNPHESFINAPNNLVIVDGQ